MIRRHVQRVVAERVHGVRRSGCRRQRQQRARAPHKVRLQLQVHPRVHAERGADRARRQMAVRAARARRPRPVHDGGERVGREAYHRVDVERVRVGGGRERSLPGLAEAARARAIQTGTCGRQNSSVFVKMGIDFVSFTRTEKTGVKLKLMAENRSF